MEIIFFKFSGCFFSKKFLTLSKEANGLCIIAGNNEDGAGDCSP